MNIKEVAENNKSGSKKIAMLSSDMIFSKLCERMDEKVVCEKPISEIDLNDFSKIAVHLIGNSFDIKSDKLDCLSRHITDYLRYKLERETDLKRAFSYIRLSQTIDILHEFQFERDLNFKAHKTLNEKPEYADLIIEIKHAPGINRKELHNKLSLRLDELCNQTQELEQQGVIVGQGVAIERHYILTKFGEAVYRIRSGRNNSEWVDQWSTNRILALCVFLILCKEIPITDFRIRDVLQVIASQSEEKISECCNNIINFMKVYRGKKTDRQYDSTSRSTTYRSLLVEGIVEYLLKQKNVIRPWKSVKLTDDDNKFIIDNKVQADIFQEIRDINAKHH